MRVDDVARRLTAGVPVTIYQGQLDLICCTLGVDTWLQRLKWPGLQAFQAAPRKAFYRENEDAPSTTAGFVRRHKHLAMYYILEAGAHSYNLIRSSSSSLREALSKNALTRVPLSLGNPSYEYDITGHSQRPITSFLSEGRPEVHVGAG